MILGAAEDLSKILARSEEIASDEGRKKYKVHPAYGNKPVQNAGSGVYH